MRPLFHEFFDISKFAKITGKDLRIGH